MLDQNTERAAAEFVKMAVDSGYSEREVRESFRKKGYPEDEVDRLLGIYIKKEVTIEHHYARYILVIAGALLVFGLVFWLLPKNNICEDQNCFIKAANSCKEAELKQLEEGSVFTYNIKKSKDQIECVLVKTATDISENENVDVQELEGKSMRCVFFKGVFNTNWINYLTKDVEGCEGTLKEGLMGVGIYEEGNY